MSVTRPGNLILHPCKPGPGDRTIEQIAEDALENIPVASGSDSDVEDFEELDPEADMSRRMTKRLRRSMHVRDFHSPPCPSPGKMTVSPGASSPALPESLPDPVESLVPSLKTSEI